MKVDLMVSETFGKPEGSFIHTEYGRVRVFSTIQAALDAAEDGTNIYIAPGTYGESVRWDGKNINLRGA